MFEISWALRSDMWSNGLRYYTYISLHLTAIYFYVCMTANSSPLYQISYAYNSRLLITLIHLIGYDKAHSTQFSPTHCCYIFFVQFIAPKFVCFIDVNVIFCNRGPTILSRRHANVEKLVEWCELRVFLKVDMYTNAFTHTYVCIYNINECYEKFLKFQCQSSAAVRQLKHEIMLKFTRKLSKLFYQIYM